MNKDLAWPLTAFVGVCAFVAMTHYTGGWLAGFEGTVIGAAFIIVALFAAGRQGISDRDLGLIMRPVLRVLMPAFWAVLIIFPVFAAGYPGWMSLWGHKIRIPSAPFTMYSTKLMNSGPARPGAINIHVTGNQLVIASRNKQETSVKIAPLSCDHNAKPRQIRLKTGLRRIDLGQCQGFTVSTNKAIIQPPDGGPTRRFTAHRTWWALFALFFAELFGVALPEELFYRGYMQVALKKVFKRRITLFGAQIGWDVVLTALLFAIGHLITVPHVFRLAVFFPGLLFGWLRERSDSIVAPTLVHALSNCLMYLLQGFVVWG